MRSRIGRTSVPWRQSYWKMKRPTGSRRRHYHHSCSSFTMSCLKEGPRYQRSSTSTEQRASKPSAGATTPLYHDLIQAFGERTGVPVLVNTSFNSQGKPIVCTPQDAVECFMTSPIDVLAIGPFVLEKQTRTC